MKVPRHIISQFLSAMFFGQAPTTHGIETRGPVRHTHMAGWKRRGSKPNKYVPHQGLKECDRRKPWYWQS